MIIKNNIYHFKKIKKELDKTLILTSSKLKSKTIELSNSVKKKYLMRISPRLLVEKL